MTIGYLFTIQVPVNLFIGGDRPGLMIGSNGVMPGGAKIAVGNANTGRGLAAFIFIHMN
jgi:hypothetical protein